MSTTICYRKDNSVIVAHNEDSLIQSGILYTNHRDIKKKAFIIPPEKPFEWVSHYGSISFSQCGKEFSSSGINETGFSAQQLNLPETVYEEESDKAVVKEFQLVQMLLDTCESSKEAENILSTIRISKFVRMIHFLVCDRSGDFRVIEFQKGEMMLYGDGGERVPVLTNTNYEDSLLYLKGIKKPEEIEDPKQRDSFARFAKACLLTARIQEYLSSPVATAFNILSQTIGVDIGWNIVYDCNQPTIHVRDNSNKSRISIPLSTIDFSKKARKLAIPITSKNDILCELEFSDYDFHENKQLIESYFCDKTTIKNLGIKLPAEALLYLALYPEKQE